MRFMSLVLSSVLGTGFASSAIAASCPDGGERLPETGICQEQAAQYLRVEQAPSRDLLPEGCEWRINETPFADQYLLYYAAHCNDKTSQLEYAGGAHFAELTLTWSALADAAIDNKLAMVGSAEADDPYKNILFYAREAMDNPTEAEKCQVRPLTYRDGWSTPGALTVDVSPAEAAKAPADEPRTACGPYGYDADNPSHWRVMYGFSWFFTPTQDAHQDINLDSLTLIERSADGSWEAADPQIPDMPTAKQAKPAKIAETSNATSSDPTPIKFARGAFSAIVTGKLADFDSKQWYSIGVGKGQTMTIEQVDDTGDNPISIYLTDPKGGDANDLDASCHSNAEISSTKAGTYTIQVVECQKADPWAGSFSIKVTVK